MARASLPGPGKGPLLAEAELRSEDGERHALGDVGPRRFPSVVISPETSPGHGSGRTRRRPGVPGWTDGSGGTSVIGRDERQPDGSSVLADGLLGPAPTGAGCGRPASAGDAEGFGGSDGALEAVDVSSFLRMFAAMANAADGRVEPRLCSMCVQLLGIDGASVAVFANMSHWGALCTSDATATTLLDLQHSLGEGPTLDAYRSGLPVSEVALNDPQDPRWLAFSGQAHAAGAAAIFAFPLRVGAARLGALTVHQRRPGPLRRAQHADALVLADALTEFVLAIQAEAPPSVLAAPLEAVASHHAQVHQAAGIIAARHGIDVSEALVRLRAHAYRSERLLAEVAREVVTGTLRLE